MSVRRSTTKSESHVWKVMGPLLLVACATSEPKTPIQLGFVTTWIPADGDYGGDGRIAGLAVDEINKQGGINGHPLVLSLKDDGSDAEVAARALQAFIHEGAVGMIGPGYSSYVELAYPIARDNKFPILSPSSSAPSLSTVDDGGYMFRAVANDSVQGVAMAYYMNAIAKPAVTQATVVYEDTPYGTGLADAFEDAFAKVGGTVDGRVTFSQEGPAHSQAAAIQVMDDLAALPHKPALVVLIGVDQDGTEIMKVWGQRPDWSDVTWFFTDGLRVAPFLVGLPAGCAGMLGTAPTFPTLGDAYGVLRDAYTPKYPKFPLDQEAFGPQVWDAVYLFAAALAAQDAAGESFGGQALRDRLTQVSRGPGLIFHAGQWRDIVGTLRGGDDIDYDGASGPVDFDAVGEAIGPYEVWKIAPSADTFVFEQQLYIDAKQIVQLRNP